MTALPSPAVLSAAERLRTAEESRSPCAPLRNMLPPGDVEAAYAVQRANVVHWVGAGRRIVGRKIGLTSPAVQRQLGVDQPDYGTLFADMGHTDTDEIAISRVLQPKVEAEVACVLGRDIVDADAPAATVLRAVELVLPCIEVVGSRVRNWDIAIVDTIADNASSGLFILGLEERKPADLDLRLCGMVLERNGDECSTGAGAACLGHPLRALAWLARRMAAQGDPLRAGEIVLTGALGPMVPVVAGDWIETRISGLGSVRVRFIA